MEQHDALRKDGLCLLVTAIMGSGFLFGDFVVGHLGVLQMSTSKMEIWLTDNYGSTKHISLLFPPWRELGR